MRKEEGVAETTFLAHITDETIIRDWEQCISIQNPRICLSLLLLALGLPRRALKKSKYEVMMVTVVVVIEEAFIKCLLGARDYSKCSTCIILFSLHNHPVRSIYAQ